MLLPLVSLFVFQAAVDGPSLAEGRATVPVTIQNGVWTLRVPAAHKGPVELRLVDRPDTVVEMPSGTPLPFRYEGDTATLDLPEKRAADTTAVVSWKNDKWDKAMQEFAAADAKAPPKPGGILFVGSSTIRIWDLDRDFPGAHALNRGFGGSHFSDAVFHFERVILPYRPSTVVIYDGDNDIAHGKSPERVFADFETLMRQIRFYLPETRVILLSVKPSVARWALWDKMGQVNALTGEYLRKQQNMHFVDIGPSLLGADGTPRPDFLQKDGLHLNPQGYAVCAGLVRPLLPGAGG